MELTPGRTGLIAALICFVFFAVLFNAQPHGWAARYQLARGGMEAQATITRSQPENHQLCYFEYIVNSKRYEGSDDGCSADIGHVVKIWYLPSDPSFSTTKSPVGEFVFSVFGPLLLSVFAGIVAAWRRSRRRRSLA